MNDDQWADAIDKMVTGLEQYNASIHALSKKSNNDTQPLGYQVSEEAPYQAYDKPIASNDWWQKEQARLLAAAKWEESFGSGYPDEKRAYLEKWGPIAEQQYRREEPEQPLLIDDPLQTEEQMAQAQKTWDELKKHPLVQTLTQRYQEAPEHIHGPFTFLMNQNHNALRGCVTCGATWVGLMAGEPANLMWHPVGELSEEEGG